MNPPRNIDRAPLEEGPVMAGAEPFSVEGGPAGVLLLHGFTGNPASMRLVGEWLAQRGHAVAAPRYPGHGTRWEDLGRTTWRDWAGEAERALDDLAARCEGVVVLGQSMGGAMALHLGARHPDRIRGVVCVNPYILDRRIAAAIVAWPVIRAVRGIGGDIKKPGRDELSYKRIPMRAVAELARFLRLVRGQLPDMRLPMLLFNSPEDHVVPKGTAEFILERVGSADREMIALPNSYHVACLDHDAELIAQRADAFVRELVPVAG